ncbi:pyocin S6 family toxin immunity protein [Pseudomonas putida]|uniref:pyocin S6 family toxin immunity protein n=1 Tax=Pseudomonas putida TaxID=303 RepID=UPI00236587C5|nr:pyocin S6 family toxin immunity protein [Pseudomonas putida]MDD2049944.1 pyocin S6 family toxin immunity protein [Pseudomonas putida]
MYLCITGFLPDNFEDTSLKYELAIDATFNNQIVQLLGHKILSEMASGEWLLSADQVLQIATLINEQIPSELDIFIGVEA